MEFYANEGKKSSVEVNGQKYMRHSIKTHFVNQGEDYIEVFKKYVSPIYQEGDIVSISEKIIALCQNRVIKREELKIGFWAKLLSKFASHPDTGYGVGETIKMQYAIHEAGLLKVLWASFASAVTKLFGKKGVFYEIVGEEVSGLDGFYDKVWDEYGDIGIKIPENPNGVCNEIKEKLGISCIIVDANDLGQELLGASDDLRAGIPDAELIKFVKDNPSGQGKELTPIILIRPLENFEKNGDTLAPGVQA
ncbi:MAG: coenzyme F420-0:L-glutamate ligase [Acutalibacteraceae bacterium]|nr:coenzyme F420-0:L-glutamate ligase [Acutalibacteraceae bacterium]